MVCFLYYYMRSALIEHQETLRKEYTFSDLIEQEIDSVVDAFSTDIINLRPSASGKVENVS